MAGCASNVFPPLLVGGQLFGYPEAELMDTIPDQKDSSQSKTRFKAVMGHALTIVSAALGILITLFIPRFAADFKKYPFEPPWLSLMVVRFYPLMLVTACGITLAAIYVACRFRTNAAPIRVAILLILCIGAQALTIGSAMILPVIKLWRTYTNQ